MTFALSRRPLRRSILLRLLDGAGFWLQRTSVPVPREPPLQMLDEATDDFHGVSWVHPDGAIVANVLAGTRAATKRVGAVRNGIRVWRHPAAAQAVGRPTRMATMR
jgi:hypothetical protein